MQVLLASVKGGPIKVREACHSRSTVDAARQLIETGHLELSEA